MTIAQRLVGILPEERNPYAPGGNLYTYNTATKEVRAILSRVRIDDNALFDYVTNFCTDHNIDMECEKQGLLAKKISANMGDCLKLKGE